MPAKRCIIYARISQARDEGAVIKVDDQIASCREKAEREGWEIVAVSRDDGISATSGKTRPGFEEVLERLRNREADVVLTWRRDRLYRRLQDYLRIYELVKDEAAFDLQSVDGHRTDLSTAEGQMAGAMFATFAAYEVQIGAERKANIFKKQAEAGKIHRRTRTWGYGDDGLTINPVEAAALRRAAQMVLAGDSMTLAATYVSDAVRSPEDDTDTLLISPRALREVLLAERIVGKRAYRSNRYMKRRPPHIPKSRYPPERLVDAEWEAILDERTWNALHLQLNSSSPAQAPRAIKGSGMLSGLMFCGECGHGLNLTAKNYSCPSKALGGCGGVAISRRMIESYFRDGLSQMITNGAPELQSPKLPASTMSEQEIAEARAPLEQQRDELIEMLRTKKLQPTEAGRQIDELDIKIEAVGQPPASEYAARRDDHAAADAIALWNEEGGPSDQNVRELLRARVQHVLIAKARTRGRVVRYDRIHVHWKATPCDCVVTDRPRSVIPSKPLRS